MKLEKMSEFFAARAEGYDRHMLAEVEGCAEAYRLIPLLLNAATADVIDLGCGTGLELTGIFARFPDANVTGIDLSDALLCRAQKKFASRSFKSVCASYVGRDFGSACFDAAVSCETMHHLSHEDKLGVYSSLCRALRPGGRYIECDFVAESRAEEEALYAENRRLRQEQNIPDGEYYHFDTPCTIYNQIDLLQRAGFCSAEKVWQEGNTAVFVAMK